MADGVDLGSVTAACNADADVYVGELVEADYEEGFVDLALSGQRGLYLGWAIGEYLEAENFRLGEGEGFAIHFYEAFAGLEG